MKVRLMTTSSTKGRGTSDPTQVTIEELVDVPALSVPQVGYFSKACWAQNTNGYIILSWV